MDLDPKKLQDLTAAIRSAIDALDELTFLLHSATASPQARQVQAQAAAALERARARAAPESPPPPG